MLDGPYKALVHKLNKTFYSVLFRSTSSAFITAVPTDFNPYERCQFYIGNLAYCDIIYGIF